MRFEFNSRCCCCCFDQRSESFAAKNLLCVTRTWRCTLTVMLYPSLLFKVSCKSLVLASLNWFPGLLPARTIIAHPEIPAQWHYFAIPHSFAISHLHSFAISHSHSFAISQHAYIVGEWRNPNRVYGNFVRSFALRWQEGKGLGRKEWSSWVVGFPGEGMKEGRFFLSFFFFFLLRRRK